MAGIYKLTGTVKHYDWGGFSFIPSLLQIVNEKKEPFAEYWMGIHPLGMSMIETGGSAPDKLSLIAPDLPFLLKVLDVKEMLSIQVHPSKEAAALEFDRENEAGIPLDAPNRCYKDANHKPELMVALSDFWLLHGFKQTDELVEKLTKVSALNKLLPVFKESGYAGLYKFLMELPQYDVNELLQPLIDEIVPLYNADELITSQEEYWAAKAALKFSNENNNIDRGIFSIFIFNLIHLKKGEGVFQASGVPHAYLKGQNVEIMANSDNVLRGGLTTKHIDVKELMKHIKCEPTLPAIITGVLREDERAYPVTVPDFTLSVFEMNKGDIFSFDPKAISFLLLTEGVVEIDDEQTVVKLQKGDPAVAVFPGEKIYLAAATNSTVFKASGNINKR